MQAPEARAKFWLYFAGKAHFYAFCDQKMEANVAPISKKLEANIKRWHWPLGPRLFPSLHFRQVLNVQAYLTGVEHLRREFFPAPSPRT